MSLLDIQNLTVQFGGLKAISNVNLSLDAGQMVGLIGQRFLIRSQGLFKKQKVLFYLIERIFPNTSRTRLHTWESAVHFRTSVCSPR